MLAMEASAFRMSVAHFYPMGVASEQTVCQMRGQWSEMGLSAPQAFRCLAFKIYHKDGG